MASFEESTQVFIVRIWCEPREIEGAKPEWRGVIEHVSSGTRRYVLDISEIERFVSRYVTEMCSNPDMARTAPQQ